MSDEQRMIEDYIPVAEISAASVREKLGGHHLSRGQIRNLHLWWARRPLAACRAAVYATFAAPTSGEERENLPGFFAQLCDYQGPVLPETDALKKAQNLVSRAADGQRPRVLDMFAGSGTVGVVARLLGRKFILIDNSREYCKLALSRIQQEASRGLFDVDNGVKAEIMDIDDLIQ